MLIGNVKFKNKYVVIFLKFYLTKVIIYQLMEILKSSLNWEKGKPITI